MACRDDIKIAILNKVDKEINKLFTVEIKGRHTYYRVNQDTFRIANKAETRGKSRAESLKQATNIAITLQKRLIKKYGNNLYVTVVMPEYVGLPVEVKVSPKEHYVEKLFAQVEASKRTEPISRLAFLQDPALFQQELIEDQGLKMVPYEAWLAQQRQSKPIVDETGQIKLFTETQKANLLESKVQFENEIKKLPMAIFNSIDIVDTVPSSLLGSDSVFFAMKDILSENGINDPLLINWVGINKDIIGHPRNLKSEEQIRQIAQSVFDKKTKEDRYVEFKVNKIALESFRNWKKALEGYPIVFQDIMLTHAIKHLNSPNRRSKYVLELSPVALTNTFSILMNKPHEANRLGKLYDMEVLATVSDAVNHEPSASGKGYWVHIPRTTNPNRNNIKYDTLLRDNTNDPNAPAKFTVEYINEIDKEYEIEFFDTKEEAENFILELRKSTPNDEDNYKKNVELLRKLSPSTWCTATSMADYYVENHDNYLLIVNGVTVAGIEAYPGVDNSKKIENIKNEIINLEIEPYTIINRSRIKGSPSTFTTTIKPFKGDNIYLSTNSREEINSQEEEVIKKINEDLQEEIRRLRIKIQNLLEESQLRKVKEVTSRANNGIASIDHLDDIIVFFEKHNLDLDNNTIKRAIRAKEKGESDVDMMNEVEFDAEHIEHLLWLEQQERIAIYIHNGEYEYEPNNWEEEHRYYDEFVAGIDNINDARRNIDIVKSHYEALNRELRAFEDIARAAVEHNSHNITYVDVNLPFYDELAIQAVTKSPYVWNYLPEEKKDLPGLREQYDQYNLRLNEADELPFSKTDTNLIQGYYDPNTDKVVVVRSNTPVDEASKVAIHEVAHRGMLRMAKDLGGMQQLGEALSAAEQQLMQKLPELLKRTGHKSLEGLMLDYGFTTESTEGKIKLLMELTARWAETLVNKPKPSWWKKLIQSITEWIKNFTGKTLNEQEVNELVGGFVQYGTKSFKPTKTSTQVKPSMVELFQNPITEVPDVMATIIYQNENCK
jgi:hypothetical protein